MITLSDGTTTLTLHPDLYWPDENNWHPVEQVVLRTVTGALIVSAATRQKGRPITLQPENDGSGWMNRATCEQLRSWALVPGQQLTLTLRGTTYSVIFRHHDAPAIEARPVVHWSDVQSDDWYLVTLKFTEV